jgi:serine/threonine protein kinase
VPKPFGTVELTPEREYLLVTEFLEGARELTEVEADDAVVDQGLAIVRRLWNAGLAHRDIKPANLLVQDGRVRLIDTLLTQLHPSPWRQAIDLANMMLCLALRGDAARVYRRARRLFTDAEIGEAFAATRGDAMPAQVRQLLRARHPDLRVEFRRMLPSPIRPIRIQRWTARRLVLLALAVALLLGVVGTVVGSILDNQLATATPLNVHNLDCGQVEPLWLMAQSVPSATLLPCVSTPLPGWRVANVAVNDGRSVVTLDHDRARAGVVVVRLTATCQLGKVVETPSDDEGVARYESLERIAGGYAATRYDLFAGGCVTYRLHSSSDLEGEFASEAQVLLGFTSRQELARKLEQRSGGRLHLDPGTPR